MTHEMRTSVGEMIRERRVSLGLSIGQTAAAAHVDPRWISRLERGMYQNPDARSLNRIAKVLALIIHEAA